MFLFLAVCACTKELTETVDTKDGETQLIYATVNAATKISYTDNSWGISGVWEAGDSFLALQDGEVVTFTLQSGAGSTSALFVAETSGVTASTQWKAVLGTKTHAEGSGTEIQGGYLGQNGTLQGLNECNYVVAESNGKDPVFDFDKGEYLSTILRIQLPAGIKSIEYTTCAYVKVTSTGPEFIYLNDAESSEFTSGKVMTVLNLDNASSSGDCIYIAVPSVNHSHTIGQTGKQYQNLRTGIVITLMNDVSDNATLSYGTLYDYDLTGKGGLVATLDFSGVTLLARPRPSDAVQFTASGTICVSVSTSNQIANTINTKWAPFNIGASESYETGNYYAFGMVSPATEYRPDWDSFQNYKFRGDVATFGSSYYDVLGYKHDKYPSKSEVNGKSNTTFYSVSKTKFDMARILWGSAWRLPHWIELAPLKDGAKTYQTIGGQNCLKVSNDETGNYLVFPCAGGWNGGKGSAAYKEGYVEIWSGDKNQRTRSNAGWDKAAVWWYKADAAEDPNLISREEMKYAFPVRPVLASSTVK